MLTEKQRAERRQGIGGSDIAAIMGYDPWRTFMDVYNEKVHGIFGESNLAMKVGNKLEELVLDEYQHQHPNIKVKTIDTIIGLKPYYRANIDALACDPITGEKLYLIEVKTTGAYNYKQYKDTYPFNYKLQIAYYAAIVDVPFVDIMVLIGNNTLKTYRYERDLEFETAILETVDAFWNECIIPQNAADFNLITPHAIETHEQKHLIKDSSILVNTIIKNHLEHLNIIKRNIKELEKEYELYKDTIVSYMGGASILFDHNNTVLATRTSRTKETFDTSLFKKENTDLYVKYVKKTSYEIFKLQESKTDDA